MTEQNPNLARLKISMAQREIRQHVLAIRKLYREIDELRTIVDREKGEVDAEMASVGPQAASA